MLWIHRIIHREKFSTPSTGLNEVKGWIERQIRKRMLLWHVLPLTFVMILSSCTGKAPEELRTNVLNDYKDVIALLERYRFPYPFLKEKIKKGKLSKRQDIRRVIRSSKK
jgi:hypothetical protein